MSEHSGIIRDSNGNYSQVSANGSVRSLTSNTALSIAEKVPFQTSKGLFTTDLVRTALVDTARIGKTVRSVAVAGGPVGMTIAAVSLVCELTSICNDAGQWMLGADPQYAGYPTTTPQYRWGGYGGLYASPEIACNAAVKVHYNGAYSSAPAPYLGDPGYYDCHFKDNNNNPIGGYAPRSAGCPDHYVFNGSLCQLQGVGTSRAPTVSDWNAKESLLNDSRFTPELHAKDQPIPVQTPSIPTPIKSPIDKKTITLKDGSGNTTGTEDEITEAQIESPTPAENPTGNPNLIKITEITTKNTYNTSNVLTSTTTTTTGGTEQPQPQSFEIDIDNMQDQPLEEKAIPGIFSHTSWGSGSCPGDRSVSYHYGTLNLTFQPACDAAIALQPLVVILAGIAALFIISGAVRND